MAMRLYPKVKSELLSKLVIHGSIIIFTSHQFRAICNNLYDYITPREIQDVTLSSCCNPMMEKQVTRSPTTADANDCSDNQHIELQENACYSCTNESNYEE